MGNTSKKDLYNEDEIFTLEADDGETLEMGFVGRFDLNGITYMALEDLRDGFDEACLFRCIFTDEGECELETILDDEEWEAVEAEFERIMNTI